MLVFTPQITYVQGYNGNFSIGNGKIANCFQDGLHAFEIKHYVPVYPPLKKIHKYILNYF